MDGHINETEHLQKIMKEEKRKFNNKMAARRCRQRKEERIRHLEHELSQLKDDNDKSAEIMNELLNSIADLKQELLQHTHQGCQIFASYQ